MTKLDTFLWRSCSLLTWILRVLARPPEGKDTSKSRARAVKKGRKSQLSIAYQAWGDPEKIILILTLLIVVVFFPFEVKSPAFVFLVVPPAFWVTFEPMASIHHFRAEILVGTLFRAVFGSSVFQCMYAWQRWWKWMSFTDASSFFRAL